MVVTLIFIIHDDKVVGRPRHFKRLIPGSIKMITTQMTNLVFEDTHV